MIAFEDIEKAAEDVLRVADAINDMIEGDRKIEFTGSGFVDPLMSAHGVLSRLAEMDPTKEAT